MATNPTPNTSPDQPTDTAGLVERLIDRQRVTNACIGFNISARGLFSEAADTITALQAERDVLQARLTEVEGERDAIQEAHMETIQTYTMLLIECDTVRQQLAEARAALRTAREDVLHLVNARGSEAEGSDDDWVGYIDAALSPATAPKL